LVAASWGSAGDSAAFAQRGPNSPVIAASELIALATPAGENRQQITVIDPQTRAMSVYHVDSLTGVIECKSVRNLTWDLKLLQFNGASPLPEEVRSMVEPR